MKIDGHIQCLDLQADYAVVDGAVNLATAATQGFQLWHTWSDLSSITKGIGVVSVAAFMALAFGNYKVYQLSQDALIDLRKNLNEVKDLQNMLQDLHDQAAQVVDEMEDWMPEAESETGSSQSETRWSGKTPKNTYHDVIVLSDTCRLKSDSKRILRFFCVNTK